MFKCRTFPHTIKTELVHCKLFCLYIYYIDFWGWGLSVWPLSSEVGGIRSVPCSDCLGPPQKKDMVMSLGPRVSGTCGKRERCGFTEFEVRNSTDSAVFLGSSGMWCFEDVGFEQR